VRAVVSCTRPARFLVSVLSGSHPPVNDAVMRARTSGAAERVAVGDRDRRSLSPADHTPPILADARLPLTQMGSKPDASPHPGNAHLPREVFFGRFGFAGVFFSV
jgi:hypothetical protein